MQHGRMEHMEVACGDFRSAKQLASVLALVRECADINPHGRVWRGAIVRRYDSLPADALIGDVVGYRVRLGLCNGALGSVELEPHSWLTTLPESPERAEEWFDLVAPASASALYSLVVGDYPGSERMPSGHVVLHVGPGCRERARAAAEGGSAAKKHVVCANACWNCHVGVIDVSFGAKVRCTRGIAHYCSSACQAADWLLGF